MYNVSNNITGNQYKISANTKDSIHNIELSSIVAEWYSGRVEYYIYCHSGKAVFILLVFNEFLTLIFILKDIPLYAQYPYRTPILGLLC